MASAYVGYTNKNKTIKCVAVKYDGGLEHLGIELSEFFKDKTDVKDMVKSTIKYISDGDVEYYDSLEYLTEADYEFFEYENEEDFIDDFEPDTFYYLYDKDIWYVYRANSEEKEELDVVLEEHT
jgi:hypothetical protein